MIIMKKKQDLLFIDILVMYCISVFPVASSMLVAQELNPETTILNPTLNRGSNNIIYQETLIF